MTPAQIEMVQSSWQQVLPIKDTATSLFYDRLFEGDPALRSLFPADIGPQRMKLATMLDAAVKGLGDLPALVPVVQSLGRRHVRYGVKSEHYPAVGAALLWTLEQGLGADFTPELRQAWTDVYGVLSSTMIEAARAEQAAT